jgi:hypothetical protein
VTHRKSELRLPTRTTAYVSRETGAAELSISPETWDRWVDEGILPKPAPGFPASTPRWSWSEVDGKLKGEPGLMAVDHFMVGAGRLRNGSAQNKKPRTP